RELFVLVRVPGAGAVDEAGLLGEIDDLAELVHADAVEDLELGLAEWRRDLVLYHLHARLGADDLVAVLEDADLADVEPDRGIELEGVAARRRLWVAIDDADLLSELVDEGDRGLRAGGDRGELAHGLAHEARLQGHVRISHLAVDLGAGRERGDRVD